MDPKGKNPGDVGLLEYLEDIIGSNKHVEDIEELDKTIEESDELRLEQTNRVKANQAELRALNADCSKAKAYIKLERDLQKLEVYK